MWNFAIVRLIRPLSLALFGSALLMAAGLAGATPALADPGSENAILLDPFDPVPEIQFRHYGADCFHECGSGEGCYHDCGYRHGCHRYCGGYRRCYHSCGYRREGCGDRCSHRCYHDCHRGCERDCHPRCERNCETWRDERSDFQAWRWNRLTHRYERQSREWDEKFGGGWYDDGDHRYHDGHGHWRDGDNRWHDGDTAKRDGGPKDGHRDHDNGLPAPVYNATPGADGGYRDRHRHDGDEGRRRQDSDEDEDRGDDDDGDDRGPPPDDRGPPPNDRGDGDRY